MDDDLDEVLLPEEEKLASLDGEEEDDEDVDGKKVDGDAWDDEEI
jgi:hypothetical protein